MKLVLFLSLLIALSLATSIAEQHQWGLSSVFTLRLNYAARQGRPLATSQFQIIWNGKVVRRITPRSYKVTPVLLKLRAKHGWNQIAFAGTGPSDSYGATIDDIRLLRPSSCDQGFENVIWNGNFEMGHHLGKGWKIFKGELEGWEGKEIEVGYGKIYNSNWHPGTHVCELDANGNSKVYQWIYFDKYYRWTDGPQEAQSQSSESSSHKLSKRLSLRFNYAARERVPFSSQGFGVYWNGRKVRNISPRDYNIHNVVVPVVAKVGVNTLVFRGQGRSDGLGTTLDNVRLIRGSQNLIVNGNFEQPNVGRGWRIFASIPGWTGGAIEVGWGRIYNRRWPVNNHIVELDARSNASVVQRIIFDKNYRRK